MNRSTLAMLALLAAAPAGLVADEIKSSDKGHMGAAAMSDEDQAMQAQKIQEKMLRMHEMMHKIMQTKGGVERERLIQEHRKMLTENMHMMHSMSDGSKCGSTQGGHKDM